MELPNWRDMTQEGCFFFGGTKNTIFFAAEKRDFFGAVRQMAPQVPTASRASWLVMDNV